MLVNCILKWIVLAFNLQICQFLATLHFLFPLLTNNFLLLLAELELFRALVSATHAVAHTHGCSVSIVRVAIWIVTRLSIGGSRERRSHWVLLPRILWLRASSCFPRSFLFASKYWFLCV